MCEHWSGFATEKDKNVSTKVSLFGAKKMTGEVAAGTAHALSAVFSFTRIFERHKPTVKARDPWGMNAAR